MLNTSTNSPRQVARGDRVTFDTDEGYQAGTVSDLRRDVGNGELHAWVELEHQWCGMFCAVPLSAILSVTVPAPFETSQAPIASKNRVNVLAALVAAAPDSQVFASSLAAAKRAQLNVNSTATVPA